MELIQWPIAHVVNVPDWLRKQLAEAAALRRHEMTLRHAVSDASPEPVVTAALPCLHDV